jgi:hypothetical protein
MYTLSNRANKKNSGYYGLPRRLKIEELFAPSTLRDIPLSEGQLVWRL